MTRKRHQNKGLRKNCDCPRRTWAKCSHAWHFNFKPRGGKDYRFSLDKHFNRHIDSKSEAEDLAADLRKQIRAGKFGQPVAVSDLTMRQLADQYVERKVTIKNAKTVRAFQYSFSTIFETKVPTVTAGTLPFGEWRVADVVTDTIERYREVRLQRTGEVGVNRHLGTLRTMFKWAVLAGYIPHTPFKQGAEVAITLTKEHGRSRRLEGDEKSALLAVCASHLRAVVEAALETGMRRGEILSLQWKQVEGMKIDESKIDERKVTWQAKAEFFLPFAKTKTKRDRRIPISTRLKSLLEMRRFDPAGQPHTLDAFVFGTEIGTRLLGFSRAWATAVLKSHGYTPAYDAVANLTPESRAALRSIDLHFHDLRREAGSRWMDGGVPLATIQRWLGHTNIAQTSAYLAGTQSSEHDAMARYEQQQAALQRLATAAGSGGQEKPPTGTKRARKLNKSTVRHEATIM